MNQEAQQSIHLPASYYREIISHAREGKPNEICGLIAGKDGSPVKLYRTTNNDPRPRVRYNVEPMQLLEILREIEQNGWVLQAIYHSHPMSEAYPSGTDTSLAYYPETVYLICSLADDRSPEVRAFNIVDGEVTELVLEIDEEMERSRAL